MSSRIEIMGCSIDNLSLEETLQKIKSFIQSGRPHQHVVVNVDKIVKASRDPELRRIINECALVNVDGMPVVWASRLLGKSLKERVAGVDLFEALVERSAVPISLKPSGVLRILVVIVLSIMPCSACVKS